MLYAHGTIIKEGRKDMKNIVKVLMRRDGLTESEAVKELSYVKEEIADAMSEGDFNLVEEIMLYDLGLEMDYIFDLI